MNKENFLIQLRDGHLNSVFGLNHVDLSKKRGGGGGGGGFVHQNVFFFFLSLCQDKKLEMKHTTLLLMLKWKTKPCDKNIQWKNFYFFILLLSF